MKTNLRSKENFWSKPDEPKDSSNPHSSINYIITDDMEYFEEKDDENCVHQKFLITVLVNFDLELKLINFSLEDC